MNWILEQIVKWAKKKVQCMYFQPTSPNDAIPMVEVPICRNYTVIVGSTEN